MDTIRSTRIFGPYFIEQSSCCYPLLTSACYSFFFLNDPPPTEFSPLPLHAALPISPRARRRHTPDRPAAAGGRRSLLPPRDSQSYPRGLLGGERSALDYPSAGPAGTRRGLLRGKIGRAHV